MPSTKKPVVLIILDGWGHREDSTDNAIAAAHTPNFDNLWKNYPHSLLEASGLAVGLPAGQMGNSEVGHTTIGAGRALDTDLVRIGKAITSGELAKNSALANLFTHLKSHHSVLHVMGLVGNGGVHASSEHLIALLRIATAAGVEKIAIHAFLDGRDTPPQSASTFLTELEQELATLKTGHIASVIGRYWAMDRDQNWQRTEKALVAMFDGQGEQGSGQPSTYLKTQYTLGKIDEHLEPVVFPHTDGSLLSIQKNDGILFFNFRADRARMLTQKISERAREMNLHFITLTEYEKNYGLPVLFSPISIETTLAKEIAAAGLTQAHIAETEKFPHATYFLNGGVEIPYPGEEHIMLDSRKDVVTHDQAPEMRAEAIADKAIEAINQGRNFIFINFANPDMVGHTANQPAIITAIETVDHELGRVLTTLKEVGGTAFVTADHGNAEVNIDPLTGEKHTSHTTNQVPAIVTKTNGRLGDGTLADIAPTILALLNLPQPGAMTGRNLLS